LTSSCLEEFSWPLVGEIEVAIGAADEEVVQRVLRNSSGVAAEEIRRDFDACAGTTVQMKICGAYRWAVQDLRLSRVYSRALEQSKGTDVEQSLRKAERAWLNYRDSQCAFEGAIGAGGGTAEGLYVLSCKEDLTKLQAGRLEEASPLR
jgi:uncharacterized protein YecT (DUF1311 family)